MLHSLLGIRLILMVGKSVPTPASYDVAAALTKVEIVNDVDGGDGFQMTFQLQKAPAGDYNLVADGTFETCNRVIIGVMLGVTPEVLIDGVVTHQQVNPAEGGKSPTLTVTGKDLTVMLDLEEKSEQYKNMPDSLIVTQLLAAYAQYGLVPAVTPTTDIPLELNRVPWQQETDLKFIHRLAERNGFTFYIEPQTFLVNKAYWGPETRVGLPQPALTKDMGSYTNVTLLDFSKDGMAPVSTGGKIVEPITKTAIPLPKLPSLKVPPLGSSAAPAKRKVLIRDTAKKNAAQGATTAAAAVTNAPDAVKGNGTLETERYGSVLRARRLVGVRGVGTSYDGNYYVRKVTHTIERGKYTQKFVISREGSGVLAPVVVP